jgi:hypothetical protein
MVGRQEAVHVWRKGSAAQIPTPLTDSRISGRGQTAFEERTATIMGDSFHDSGGICAKDVTIV